MVTAIIIKTALNPVILSPISMFREMIARVMTAIDNPKERAILSMTFICLKKTSVQAKPGRKNTNINPSIPLMMGNRSRKGRASSKNSLIGDSQSMPYISSVSIFNLDGI